MKESEGSPLAHWSELPSSDVFLLAEISLHSRSLGLRAKWPRRADVESCKLKSWEEEKGGNGDAERDQMTNCLRTSIPLDIPPRVLDIKSLSLSLSPQRSTTLSQTFTGKKGLIDFFQVAFVSLLPGDIF